MQEIERKQEKNISSEMPTRYMYTYRSRGRNTVVHQLVRDVKLVDHAWMCVVMPNHSFYELKIKSSYIHKKIT